VAIAHLPAMRTRHYRRPPVCGAGGTDLLTAGIDDTIIFASTGVAHLLGYGAPELTGLAGEPPLLKPSRLAIVGSEPRETNDEGRRFLAKAGVSFQEAPALIADPADAARLALAAIAPASGPIVVHFDVDMIDSGDLPLANFPHYDSGVRIDQAVALLRTLRAHPAFAGLVLTEVNPTHDADGSQLDRYVSAIVGFSGLTRAHRGGETAAAGGVVLAAQYVSRGVAHHERQEGRDSGLCTRVRPRFSSWWRGSAWRWPPG
jgi:hypothetical protein